MISYVSNTIDRLIPARYYLEDHDNIIDTIKLRYFVLILLLFLLTTPFLCAMGTYMGSLVPLIAAGIISVFGAISLILILNYQKIRLAMYTFMIAIECVLIFSTIFSTVPLDYPRLLIWIPLIEITILLFLGWKLTYPVFLINIFVVYRYLEQRAIEAGLSGAEHDKNMFGMLITIIAGHHLLIVLGYIIEQSSKRSLTQMKEHQTEELRSTHTNEVSRIVQTLSHEINNPLTYIQGVSQVLAHIAANDDIQRSKVQSIATDLATTSKKYLLLFQDLKRIQLKTKIIKMK